MQLEAYMGEIRLVAFGRVPLGWAPCDGKLLPISGFGAMFDLIGAHYGGDGINTFALPDLRGRSAVGAGEAAAGGVAVALGQHGGQNHVTLTTAQMPTHSHSAGGQLDANSSGLGASPSPAGAIQAAAEVAGGGPVNGYALASTADTKMAPFVVNVQSAGDSQAVDVRSPFLGLQYLIALEGIYPNGF